MARTRGRSVIRYVVTTHEGASGAYLSRRGDWGNIPHTSVAAATSAAIKDADGKEHTIEREKVARRRTNANA